MKIISIYLLMIINIFSLTNEEIIKKIESKNYNCDTRTEKVFKITGKNFTGHLNNEGKFYGETIINGRKYCFLKDSYQFYSDFDKDNNKYYLKDLNTNERFYKTEYGIEYINSGGVVHFFERKNNAFKKMNGRFMIFYEDFLSGKGILDAKNLQINEREIE
jgi:hypothetical protein